MQKMNNEQTPIEKVNTWIKNSVMLKLMTITILVLLLLIPASMIKSIITEREYLNQEVTAEVSEKWAGAQVISGPILTIPLLYESAKDDKMVETIRYFHVLPELLNVDGFVDPQKLNRGIYEVVVYKSTIDVQGKFKLEETFDAHNLKAIMWNKSFLTIGISDLRGIEDKLNVKWNKHILEVTPGSHISDIVYSGITVNLPDLEKNKLNTFDFEFQLKIQGSKNISFIPVGSETNVNLNSSWHAPSFNGTFLPDSRDVTDEGFEASWKVLELNRNYPKHWTGNNHSGGLNQSALGVDLIFPLDDYQKSMRSAKYAIMTIALSFLIFFLVEILNKRKIHPFQYTLVGLSLCLFYILLISISEHADFNIAYLISAVAVVAMISLYSLSVFKNRKLSFLLLFTLSCIYGFLFVTLQLADYALLMGSIGLLIILGATMYFTRNINWYRLNISTE